MQYSFPWWRFCVIKFWLVRFPNSKFLLHFMFFKIFWSLYFKSLRLLNTRRVSNQKRQLLSLFSFKRQFNMFFSLCRIDDWKPRIIKKNKKVTEQVELSRVNFTNVVIFNNKNFELLTATFFVQRFFVQSSSITN